MLRGDPSLVGAASSEALNTEASRDDRGMLQCEKANFSVINKTRLTLDARGQSIGSGLSRESSDSDSPPVPGRVV